MHFLVFPSLLFPQEPCSRYSSNLAAPRSKCTVKDQQHRRGRNDIESRPIPFSSSSSSHSGGVYRCVSVCVCVPPG